MAIKKIPTGILREKIVEELPKTGFENVVYRRLVEDEELREMQITDDFIWYDNEWHDFSFDARIFGAYFERFQRSVINTLAELEARIEALEPIHFTGLDDLEVGVNEEFDPMDGVTAIGCNDTEATVTVSEVV